MTNNIKSLSETEEGQLLLAAIACITTESRTDQTPDEVLQYLQELRAHMVFNHE